MTWQSHISRPTVRWRMRH